jgi:hypothetical protein
MGLQLQFCPACSLLIKTSFRDAGNGLATPFANLHPTSQDNPSLKIPKERGREGGLETPGAETWMQMGKTWGQVKRLARN